MVLYYSRIVLTLENTLGYLRKYNTLLIIVIN
jgi:hypothetical protein